ncbi:hypothetical protein EJ08DRAFT_560761, partial [Tothia fuscella]
MPLYLLSHAAPLSESQQDELAQAITKTHTTLFTAPSLFVNVRFTSASGYIGYVGGKRSHVNTIVTHVRHGPSRTKKMYDQLVGEVASVWANIVKENTDVRIFVMGDIVAGFEHGYCLPEAGGDVEWMKRNMSSFEEKARGGNEEMKRLVEEI